MCVRVRERMSMCEREFVCCVCSCVREHLLMCERECVCVCVRCEGACVCVCVCADVKVVPKALCFLCSGVRVCHQ